MRLIEVWRTLMCKRFGSVAAQSALLTRVVARLTSWGGLVDVRRCIDAGVVFQDATAGIPECSLLAAEFAKCKAGGLPPPARIPSEAEQKAELARKAAAEAEEKAKQKKAEEYKEKKAAAAQEAAAQKLRS